MSVALFGMGVTKEPAQAIELGKALGALMKLSFVDDTDKDGEDFEAEGERNSNRDTN